MMKVIGTGEYSEIISRYFQHSFPKVAKISKDDLLEILTDIMVGTKDYRYGPKPKVEALYTIRQTLAKSIELGAPIPILVPWGGRKSDPSLSVDIAEVSAIKQLVRLDEYIKTFYPAGLHIHIRIEDTGALWIYRTEDVDQSIEQYSSDMVKLVKILKGTTHIEPIRESQLMDKDEYFRLSETYSELIEGTIIALKAYKDLDINTIPEFNRLKELGWKGEISEDQREYYISRYRKLYPGLKDAEYDLMVSDYLGGSKARYDLKGRGEPDSSVGSYIQITFVPPIPGAPRDMFSNTLYYRTIPESSGRTHIAPWRGKGYLEILDDSPIAKITSTQIADLVESEVTLKSEVEDISLTIRADYKLTTAMMYMPMIA